MSSKCGLNDWNSSKSLQSWKSACLPKLFRGSMVMIPGQSEQFLLYGWHGLGHPWRDATRTQS